MDADLKRVIELMNSHRYVQKGIKKMTSCTCPRDHAFFIKELTYLKRELEEELLFFIPETLTF